MGKRIFYLVVALIVAMGFYFGCNRYGPKRSGANGDVFSSDPMTDRTKVNTEAPAAPPSATKAGETESPAPNGQLEQPAAPPEPAQTPLSDRTPTAPATDTISPNPPNGMVFSGTGKYQLYRQGNLTWRLNTETGQSCIIFATDEEWKKPRVYRAGCGNR